jgi:radical SAM superfamily enzyme YgiQ (UPF0313 family)
MTGSFKKPKIVLFHPHYEGGNYGTAQRQPTNLLSISGFPAQRGYEIVIVDATVKNDYRYRILKECEDALCFGSTSLIGYGAYHSYNMGKEVKLAYPSLPVVAGGWFPSVESEMFIRQGGADIVVMRQGELTFMELLEALRSGGSLNGIEGIAFKDGDEVVFNPQRKMADMNGMPSMPYHLIDFEEYFASDSFERARGVLSAYTGEDFSSVQIRALDYFSSFGCPDACTFCTSPTLLGRKWTALEAGRIVDEIDHLVHKHGFNLLRFDDANWGVSEKRVYEFCDGILKKGIKIYWAATIESHVMNKFDDTTIDLMSESGCFKLGIGAEAAHPETLDNISKNIEPGDILQSVEKCRKRRIVPSVFYIIGYPGESEESIQDTIEESCEIISRWPEVEIDLHPFMPLPETPLYDKAIQMGYEPIRSMELWADHHNWRIGLNPLLDIQQKSPLRKYNPAAFSSMNAKQVKTIRRCRKYYFWWGSERSLVKIRKMNFVERMLRRVSLFRMKHRILGFPIEFWALHIVRRVLAKAAIYR